MPDTCAASSDLQPRVTCEIQSRVLFFFHTLEHFFTLSHSLPLQESHLNTRLLIAEIQANLARNKANKMVDKIQSYNNSGVLGMVTLKSPSGVLFRWFFPFVNKSPVSNLISAVFSLVGD